MKFGVAGYILSGALAIFSVAVWPRQAEPRLSEIALVVDPTTTHQTITGWEATAYAAQDSSACNRFKDEVLDTAFPPSSSHASAVESFPRRDSAGASSPRSHS